MYLYSTCSREGGCGGRWKGRPSKAYPIDQIKDQPHRHAKLLEIQLPVIVHVRQIPDPFELVVTQLAIFEHRCGLGAVQVRAAVRERREDFPVPFDFPLLDFVVGHFESAVLRNWVALRWRTDFIYVGLDVREMCKL